MKLNVLTPKSVIHVRKVLPSTVETRDDQRTVAARDFYQASKDSFHFTTVLKPNELIKELHLPITETLKRSIHLKIRDRRSYAFAVACCSVRIVFGCIWGGCIWGTALIFGGSGCEQD